MIPVSGMWTAVAARAYRTLFAPLARVVVVSHGGYDVTFHRASLLGINGAVATQPVVLERMRVSHPAIPATLIPYGVDAARFRTAPAIKIDLPRPIVIVTAALVPYKRVHLAVHAVAETNSMSLLVVGDGPLREEVCALGERLLGPERFCYHPSVPFNQIAGYYKSADVYTLPSTDEEAFSVAIVEAMAAGIPVVVNDDPVRRWIVDGHGTVADPTNTQDYAAALVEAASRGRATSSGEAIQRFDWTTVAQQWSDYCRELLSYPHS